VKLVEQWRTKEDRLRDDWSLVRLDVVVEPGGDRARAAALLGPANPGQVGDALRIHVRRVGGPGAVGPEGARRLFERLDRERIWSDLQVVDVEGTVREEEAPPAGPPAAVSLAQRWVDAVAALPPDWSDVYAELRLRSTDDLPRAALLCAPLNPTRTGPIVLSFRAARRAGYGASPMMVSRCLERMDAEGIRGDVEILRVLSETRHVSTQGPVWRVAGKSV
jgi:hypothetical protein